MSTKAMNLSVRLNHFLRIDFFDILLERLTDTEIQLERFVDSIATI